MLAVLVNDADAVYPIRIDPTFSDANWISMGGFLGANGDVYAAAVDSSGSLYVGGSFNVVGDVFATNIAKWDGNSWTGLGLGRKDEPVTALAIWGGNLYAGGNFTTAGGRVSAYIARAYLPALPTLSVLRSSENVTVSWPTVDTAGFALEQAGPLAAPAGWVTNSATVTNDGTNKSVTLPATNSPQFFRLRRP